MNDHVEPIRFEIVALLVSKDATMSIEELLRQARLLENYVVKGETPQ